MLNKVLVLFFAIVIIQLIYFLVKSTKDRLNSGNMFLKSKEYIRGYIMVVLLVLLIVFMLT